MWLALTDEWRSAAELAEAAGIRERGSSIVLVSLVERGLAERRPAVSRWEYCRAGTEGDDGPG